MKKPAKEISRRRLFINRDTAQMYHKLRVTHPFIGAKAILAWARDIVSFRRMHEKFPALDGTTDKSVRHTYKGIEFSTRVEFDPDAKMFQGSFSNEKESKWSIKNQTAWVELKFRGYSNEYLWWNPSDDPAADIKYWQKFGCSKSVAHGKVLDMLKEMYKTACANESFYLVVKVYLGDTKLGDASLGGLDRSQIDGEDSKCTLLEVLGEAIEESKKTLAEITKNAARFRRVARRF